MMSYNTIQPQVFEVNIQYAGRKPEKNGSLWRDECAGNRYFKLSLEPFTISNKKFDALYDSITKEITELAKAYPSLTYTIEFTNPNEDKIRLYDNINDFGKDLQRCHHISAILTDVVIENPRL